MTEPATLIYITTANKEEAISISRALLAERLVACVNIMDHVLSMYWWMGEIEHNAEAVIIVKTRTSLQNLVISKVKSLHSYDVPAIVCIPMTDGNPDFVDWITAETTPKS
jgi:periplasmic divalent cation tolerance protein